MKVLLLVLVVVSLGFSATLEIIITEEELQSALVESIEDTRISSLETDIQEDVIVLTAVREMPLQTVDLEVEIWLDPENPDENIWTVKSGTANGQPFGATRIELWNLWFNAAMDRMGETNLGRADNITIEPDEITMVWAIAEEDN
jgi:hypothetical protein